MYFKIIMGRHPIPFLGLGLAYIEFAKTEKNLFKFLFMSDEYKGRSVFDMVKDDENRQVVGMISGATGLNYENAERLFIDIWVMTHGIASMAETDNSDFSSEEPSQIKIPVSRYIMIAIVIIALSYAIYLYNLVLSKSAVLSCKESIPSK